MTLPLLLTLAGFMASSINGDEPRPPTATPVGGGALVSPDAKVVYAPAKDGGIEAIDLATGKVRWTNADAKRLAGASLKFAIGWTSDEKKPHTFRLVAIDAETGKTVRMSDPIEMPDWATTTKTWGRTFRVAARAEAAPVVVWQANAFYAGGARPTPEIEEAARKEAVGVATIDLKTGKITPVDRKPTAEEFRAGPDGGATAKVGEFEFEATEMEPRFKPGVPMVTTVTLAVRKGKSALWKRELAGNPWSPPRP